MINTSDNQHTLGPVSIWTYYYDDRRLGYWSSHSDYAAFYVDCRICFDVSHRHWGWSYDYRVEWSSHAIGNSPISGSAHETSAPGHYGLGHTTCAGIRISALTPALICCTTNGFDIGSSYQHRWDRHRNSTACRRWLLYNWVKSVKDTQSTSSMKAGFVADIYINKVETRGTLWDQTTICFGPVWKTHAAASMVVAGHICPLWLEALTAWELHRNMSLRAIHQIIKRERDSFQCNWQYIFFHK